MQARKHNYRQVDDRSSLAPGLPEDPVAHDLLGEAEGHDDEAEGEVGDGQRGHEPVLLRVERGLVEDWGGAHSTETSKESLM